MLYFKLIEWGGRFEIPLYGSTVQPNISSSDKTLKFILLHLCRTIDPFDQNMIKSIINIPCAKVENLK